MSIKEKLIIKNFFSIKEFEWDIKGFNVLTGGMGSGKSIALKLLYFCEQILQKIIFSEPNLGKERLAEDNFFDAIENHFNRIFPYKSHEIDFRNTVIDYEFSLFKEEENDTFYEAQFVLFDQPILAKFDLSAEWNDKAGKFKWSSIYIMANIKKWQKFFDVPKTLDLSDNAKNSIYNSIISDFRNTFPLASMFIPASRAIAAIADTISSRDQFINSFMSFKNFALSFDNISNDIVNNILRIRNIYINDNKEPIFELLDERKITSLELSSGQQELLYLLLLVNDLKDTVYKYGEAVSVFIEEPCAHLFPKEQKETMEFLVTYFHLLQNKKDYEPGHRFFISTHSPYILDTLNNILEKGRLLRKAKKIKNAELKDEILNEMEKISFQHIEVKNVSAYMIDDDGFVRSMINSSEDSQYIYSKVIENIANVISVDADKLFTINDRLNEIFS